MSVLDVKYLKDGVGCLAVPAHSGQILHGIFLQKFDNLVHDKYLHGGMKLSVWKNAF